MGICSELAESADGFLNSIGRTGQGGLSNAICASCGISKAFGLRVFGLVGDNCLDPVLGVKLRADRCAV